MKHFFALIFLFALGSLQTAESFSTEVKLQALVTTGITFDSNLPKPEDITGIKVGERHWYSHEIQRYLDALAEASPRMVALGEHARSYGGRPLISYAISSPANIANLEQIKTNRALIVDPKANIELSSQPAVVHMMYSIHGNEPSGTNATPLVAYYLNAAQDEQLEQQLKNVVIIFNPMQNPDGLDRFANWSNNHRGLNPSSDPNDREHREHTPNGRGNYYGFDLNRDWLAHQFPESRGRLALFHEWKPNVQLDFHEQGSNNHFFFMPGKPERTNPLTPKINQVLTSKIGEYHAQVLDQKGVLYFTQENYDDFFMGKGSTYPDLFGTVGILFEQPSSRGAHQQTINGLLDFPTTIGNQFLTSLSSIRAASDLKDDLLAYQRDHLVNAKQSKGYYLARAEGDPTRLKEFMRVLQGHNIQIQSLTEDISAEGHVFSAKDSIAIARNQPNAAYLEVLWNRPLTFEENVFYDVSTWTLPLAFDLDHTEKAILKANTAPLPDGFLNAADEALPTSHIGYLIDWRDSATAALLYDLLDAGANVRAAKRPFRAQTHSGARDFGYGSLFVSPALNTTVPERVMSLLYKAAEEGLPVYAAASSFTSSGIDLGSREFEVLTLPKVLLVTGPGTSGYDTAEIWHLLDRVVDMPLTMLDTFRLLNTDLSDYTHILLTDPLKSLPGISKKLDAFVQAGGVLFAQGDSTIDWLSKEGVTEVVWKETANQKLRADFQRTVKKDSAIASDLEKLLPPRGVYADADNQAAYGLVRGVILNGDIDITHPLGYGYTDRALPMFRTNNRFMLRSSDPYSTPIAYTENALMTGYMSIENQELASHSASIIVDSKGKGAMILSLDDPAFRAFWWGSQRVLINSIFFGEML